VLEEQRDRGEHDCHQGADVPRDGVAAREVGEEEADEERPLQEHQVANPQGQRQGDGQRAPNGRAPRRQGRRVRIGERERREVRDRHRGQQARPDQGDGIARAAVADQDRQRERAELEQQPRREDGPRAGVPSPPVGLESNLRLAPLAVPFEFQPERPFDLGLREHRAPGEQGGHRLAVSGTDPVPRRHTGLSCRPATRHGDDGRVSVVESQVEAGRARAHHVRVDDEQQVGEDRRGEAVHPPGHARVRHDPGPARGESGEPIIRRVADRACRGARSVEDQG
jgi:hypothetical protein